MNDATGVCRTRSLSTVGIEKGQSVFAFLSFNCHRLLGGLLRRAPTCKAILLPLNIRLSAEELTYILNDASPRVLFFDPEFIPLVETLRQHTISTSITSSPSAHRFEWGGSRNGRALNSTTI